MGEADNIGCGVTAVPVRRESPAVRLRAVEPDDARMMWEAENESVMDGTGDYMAPLSMAQLREYALGYDADPYRAGQLRLIAEADGVSVGIVDLYEISVRDRTAWSAVWIRPSMRHRGYGVAAVGALWSYATGILGLRTLGARIGSRNAASLSLFAECGWDECGVLRGWRRLSCGGREDVVICQKSDQP